MDKRLRLVICDIDSTLTTSTHQLTPRTKAVIDHLHEQGIYVGIASGRPLDELDKKAKLWGFDYPFDILIGMNGSELWDQVQQKEYAYFKMKREWLKEALDLMEPFDSNCFIYQNGALLCERDDATMRKSAASSNKPLYVAKQRKELYAQENAKIMFRVKESDVDTIEQYLRQHTSTHYKGFKTQATLIEFADVRVSKAYALQQFCKMHAIAMSDVVAFGDTTNDNEMLQCSGLGVCMINGSDDTKAVADDITQYSNDEDGFARYMEEYMRSMEGKN